MAYKSRFLGLLLPLLLFSFGSQASDFFTFHCPSNHPQYLQDSLLGAQFKRGEFICSYGVGFREWAVEFSPGILENVYDCSFEPRPKRGQGLNGVKACLGNAQDCALRCLPRG